MGWRLSAAMGGIRPPGPHGRAGSGMVSRTARSGRAGSQDLRFLAAVFDQQVGERFSDELINRFLGLRREDLDAPTQLGIDPSPDVNLVLSRRWTRCLSHRVLVAYGEPIVECARFSMSTRSHDHMWTLTLYRVANTVA